jgi:hypothetical protein
MPFDAIINEPLDRDGIKKLTLGQFFTKNIIVLIFYTLCLGSSETVSFFLPFALREANTLRPFAVDIRSRNPCLFFLFLLDG